MTLWERIQRFRCGGKVRRYHTSELIHPPNDAEHMYGVTIIVDQIYRHAYGFPTPAGLLIGALYHDQAEYETGDTPGWVKKVYPSIKTVLVKVEADIEARLGISTPGGGWGQLIKTADEFEHLWTCINERALGNQNLNEMFNRTIVYIEERVAANYAAGYPWAKAAEEIFLELVDQYRLYDGGVR